MYLLIRLSDSTATKNKLDKAISDYYQTIDSTLVELSDWPKFKDSFLKIVGTLNSKYPRCKPYVMSVPDISPGTHSLSHISGTPFQYVIIQPIKNILKF